MHIFSQHPSQLNVQFPPNLGPFLQQSYPQKPQDEQMSLKQFTHGKQLLAGSQSAHLLIDPVPGAGGLESKQQQKIELPQPAVGQQKQLE